MTQPGDIDRARIVVIGGGAVGCSILWHLAQAGQTDAVLVEKHELTAGSTWHAAGNVPTVSNSWLGQRAGNYAWRLYSELAADPDDPITYRHTRAFWPGHTAERIDHFHHVIGIATGLGFDLHLVSPAEMEAMHPFWRDDGTVIAGLLDPYEGDIDPSGLAHGLARRARRLGARVRRHSRVVGIEALGPGHDSDWRVHLVAGGAPAAIDCEIIVNAAGFHAAEVGRMAGTDIPLAVLEHQYLVTGPVAELAARRGELPLVRDPEIMFYLRREQDAFLFGSYGHEGRTVWETGAPDVFDSGLFAASTDDIAGVACRAAAHVPLLGEVGIARFVNGPIVYSADASPLVGPAAGLDNLYLAAGVQIGITHAAAAGKALTEMITGGDTEWDMWPWDPRRFGSWALAGSGRRSYANVRVRELYEHQYAEPFPHRIWESARPVHRSPLYDTLAARGANFGQVAGWERAFWFSSTARYSHKTASYRDEPWHDAVRDECLAVRDRAGIMDHPGFSRFEVSGAGAAGFLDRVFCTRLPDVGRVRLAYMLRPNGTVWSEATIARPDPDRYLLLGPTAARERDFDWLRRNLRPGEDVELRLGERRAATLMVMGPASRELLSRLCDEDLSRAAAPWMSARQITVAGVEATALRVSFVGELGWELHVDDADLVALYEALREAGEDLGVSDFGSYALDSMRIEKGYHGWQTEFGVEYTPFDAGLERFVHLDKGEFIGRAGALEAGRRPPEWSYGIWTVDVGLLPGESGDPPPSATIRIDGRPAGYVTSAGTGFRTGTRVCLTAAGGVSASMGLGPGFRTGTRVCLTAAGSVSASMGLGPGFRTGTRVCLGYVEGQFAAADTGFTIDVFGTPCPAARHRQAVYDPDHLRPRS